jgi:hypothetical protein
MHILPFPLLLLLLIGCSHLEGPSRQVQFPISAELVLKVQQNVERTPASSVQGIEFSDVSVRRIYFSSLYQQYTTLGHFLNRTSSISSCPQFHHDKLEKDSKEISRLSVFRPAKIGDDGLPFFPELAFNKDFSMVDYHDSLKKEVEILCEEGVSDNFYKFDNLVTHYSQKSSFHRNPSAIISVLKIPVFANFYLLKMLEAPGFEGTSTEEKILFQLTRTHWFESYVLEASRIRNHLLKNKTVRN